MPPPPRRFPTASHIDGDVSEWAGDEWVLDASTSLPEISGDSRWGTGDDIVRVGVTWDARFLYVAVEFNASSSSLLVALGYGPGGLASLDGAGTFRRAIDLPFAANVLVLADAHGAPELAHVDDRGVLVLFDRATAPAVVRASPDGSVVLEAAIPWSKLSLAKPLELVAAITGNAGTGAGDAAPDPSVALPVGARPSSKVRATLDRWLSIPADGDDDGTADANVSPRTAVTVRSNDDATAPRAQHAQASVRTNPRVFAPDNGEETSFRRRLRGHGRPCVRHCARVFSRRKVGARFVRRRRAHRRRHDLGAESRRSLGRSRRQRPRGRRRRVRAVVRVGIGTRRARGSRDRGRRGGAMTLRRSLATAAIVWVSLGAASNASAHFEGALLSSRTAALGGAFVAIADDPSAVVDNPAGLSGLTQPALLATYQKPYGVDGLDEGFVALSVPARWVTAGAGWFHRGLDGALSEDRVTLSVARDLKRTSEDASLSIGLSVDFAAVSAQGDVDANDNAVVAGCRASCCVPSRSSASATTFAI